MNTTHAEIVQSTKKKLLHYENGAQTWLIKKHDNTHVILKNATNDAANEQIQKELWCLQKLQRKPFKIPILSEGVDIEGFLFFERQYFPLSLNQLLLNETSITLERASNIILQLLEQLIYLHSRGFLYIDLKPDNLLLTDNGELAVCDFGSLFAYTNDSKVLVNDLSFWNQQIYCSEKYRHPELASTDWQLGPWVDIYAAGKIIQDIAAKMPVNQAARLQSLVQLCLGVDLRNPQNVLNHCIRTLNESMGKYQQEATRLLEPEEVPEVSSSEPNRGESKKTRSSGRAFIAVSSVIAILLVFSYWLLDDSKEGEIVDNTLSTNNQAANTDAGADTETLLLPADIPEKEKPQVDLSSLNTSYTRELRYQSESGSWIKLPFIRQVVNEKVIWVLAFEVDNQLYSACISAGKCSSNTIFSTRESRKRLNQHNMPAVNVSWVMIHEEFLPFAKSVFGLSMRLPTLQEWELLSATTRKDINDGVYFMHCNNCRTRPASYDGGPLAIDALSPDNEGFVHLFGNVREWLGGCAYDTSGIERCYQAFVAGGSWREEQNTIINNPIAVLQKRARSIDTGFRLVFDE